ncbi:hypothetical protein [Finegoldia magna]|uniref:hypothetical protein n=1 Tax=Finegoldia magna TaxID=1260 RepID=UPI0023A9E45A|nr:hypothetical protein [Finegoldia magna]MCC2718086.1 hypothetical protein [Finegoldia magna]
MKLLEYNAQYIRLTDIKGISYDGYAHYCAKDDYEVKEDGLEMRVDRDIWIFYESDIKSIEILD